METERSEFPAFSWFNTPKIQVKKLRQKVDAFHFSAPIERCLVGALLLLRNGYHKTVWTTGVEKLSSAGE